MALDLIEQRSFALGEFPEAAGEPGSDETTIPDGGARLIENGLIGDDGILYRRGGAAYHSQPFALPFTNTPISFLWTGHLTPGDRTVFSNQGFLAVLNESNIPLSITSISPDTRSTAVIEGFLFMGAPRGVPHPVYAGARKLTNYNEGTVTVTKDSKIVTGSGTLWLANADAGMLFIRDVLPLYIVESVDSNTQITLRRPYEEITQSGVGYLLKFVEGVPSDGSFAWLAEFYTVCANRLVAGRTFGDVDADGTTLLRFSEIGKPWSFLAADRHRLPEGVEIKGVATVGQTVLIFTTQGIWTLEGLAFDITDDAGNPQHRLQRYSHDLVLTGEPGIASLGDALVVPCTDGIFLMDGISAPLRISRSIDPAYRTVTKLWSVGRAAVYRNHYFLPFNTADHTEIRKLWVCRLDRPSDSPIGVVYPWTEFSQDGASVSGFAVTPGAGKLLGAGVGVDKRILDCSGYFTPSVGNKSDAGGTFGFALRTRLYPTGNNTLNRVKQLRLSYELADAAADNPTITAQYTSDLGDFAPLLLPSATAPENLDPEKPHKWRVNKRLRRVGYAIQCADPTSKLIIRKVETRISPSEATRR